MNTARVLSKSKCLTYTLRHSNPLQDTVYFPLFLTHPPLTPFLFHIAISPSLCVIGSLEQMEEGAKRIFCSPHSVRAVPSPDPPPALHPICPDYRDALSCSPTSLTFILSLTLITLLLFAFRLSPYRSSLSPSVQPSGLSMPVRCMPVE